MEQGSCLQEIEGHERADEKAIIEREWTPVSVDMIWECIRCMKCCRSNWAINLTWVEHGRLIRDSRTKNLDIDRLEVDPESGASHPYFLIEDQCPMLEEDTRSCSLHPDWPYTCATYPFLLMPDGRLLYHEGCRGFGNGARIDPENIREKILRQRRKAGMII